MTRLWLLALCVVATAVGVCSAQPLLAPPRAAPLDLSPPAPDASMAAYEAVESWVRAWEVPPQASLRGLERMGGAAVTLRQEQLIIGRGVSFSAGPGAVAEATRAALAQSRDKLLVGRDALAQEHLHKAAGLLRISVELAGPLIPIQPALFVDVDTQLQPGLDGVAVRLGEKVGGVFPAAMLVMNMSPSESLTSAISETSGDPTLAVRTDPRGQPGALAKTQGAVFYRFRVAHVAQVGDAGAPAFLFRGGKVVEMSALDRGGLERFAALLASNLRTRIERDQGRLSVRGIVLPFQGRYEETASPLLDEVMTAAALARYARVMMTHGPEPSLAEELLRQTAPAAGDEAVAAAAWVVAAAQVGDVEAAATDRARIGGVLATAYDAETGWMAELPEASRGLIALALVLESQSPGLDEMEKGVRAARAAGAMASIYRDTPPARLVAQMPWLGMAELARPKVEAAAALRDLRAQVWKHQLTDEDASAEAPDLVGGIVFTSARNPLPTWQTVRPVLLLAQMNRDERVTSTEEALRDLGNLLRAVRFLRQLSVDHYSGYAAAVGRGGVRSSLWDQRQPVEATAMTLWTVCEVLETVRELGERK